MDAHQKAHEIIEEHRAQRQIDRWKLLEHETLDAKAIKSLFEEGKMPEGTESSEYPSEKLKRLKKRNVRWKKKMQRSKLQKTQRRCTIKRFWSTIGRCRNSESQPTDQENKDDNA